MNKKKWYVVWKGRRPGIYDTWGECKKEVEHYPDPRYKSYTSLSEAERNYPYRVDFTKKVKKEIKKDFSSKPTYGIIVDGSYSASTNSFEYRGFDLNTGDVLFSYGPYYGGTNNVAEFLALYEAIRYVKENDLNIPIYSDSITALAWVRKKDVNTTFNYSYKVRNILNLLDEGIEWLQENQWFNRILLWETKKWGENPADYGRK